MVSQNVAEIIQKHVTLEVESIDRMYLNGYVPSLQTEGGFVYFVRRYSCPEKFCPIERAYPAVANKGLKSVW